MSEFIEIIGGKPLRGTIQASGAKNAALPVLIATLLTGERCQIHNVPNLEDVTLTLRLLQHFGAEVSFTDGTVDVSVPRIKATEASYSLVKALRASFWVLGPILARGGAARVALPGGDIIGARPVDIHLDALTRMGADIKVKHGVVYATAPNGLKATEHEFWFPSVGATHQVMMAAALVRGTTVIRGAAREPEIVAVADFLNCLGAEVEGAGNSTIIIRGSDELSGTSFRLIGDRIETATYLLAGAATGGSVCVQGIKPEFFGSFIDVMQQMNLSVVAEEDSITVSNLKGMKAVDVSTAPFPGLATDIHPPLMAALCLAEGESTIEETVFEGRFGHVSELCRMGGNITVRDRIAHVKGVSRLSAAPVEVMDIRAGAALIIGALAADGTSAIHEPQHLRRGYSGLESKIMQLGGIVGQKLRDPEDYLFTGC